MQAVFKISHLEQNYEGEHSCPLKEGLLFGMDLLLFNVFEGGLVLVLLVGDFGGEVLSMVEVGDSEEVGITFGCSSTENGTKLVF